MTLALVIALSLSTELQVPASDRSHAVELARAGQTTEALELFKRIIEKEPGDVEARLWIARLDLRLGRTEAAEAGFRSVLEEHPADVDARVGLGRTLTRKGASAEALAVLREAELQAGQNADLFGALARVYRRVGDNESALEYFKKAKTLSPADPDIVSGYEATANAYGHSIVVEGFGENVSPGSGTSSGAVLGTLRATPRLHVQALARLQNRGGVSDSLGGGGVVWRVGRATTIQFAAQGGAGNVSLPTGSVAGEVIHYAGAFEVGGSVRRMLFDGVDVTAVSPLLSWDTGDRWRFDARYTYSQSRFDTIEESAGNHSVMLRETWRGWRRVWVTGVYAYGIESFEDLTVDRVSSLGATTAAAGLRFGMPSLTAIYATWEHQWRSNDSEADRFTVSITQGFP